VRFQNQTKIN